MVKIVQTAFVFVCALSTALATRGIAVVVNNKDTPRIADEFRRTFQILRSLPYDIPLASHPAMYNLADKFPKLDKGPNPLIDPAGYKAEIDIAEGVFTQVWAEQGGK